MDQYAAAAPQHVVINYLYGLTEWSVDKKVWSRLTTCVLSGKELNHKVPLDYAVHIQTHQDCTVGIDQNFYKYIIHNGLIFSLSLSEDNCSIYKNSGLLLKSSSSIFKFIWYKACQNYNLSAWHVILKPYMPTTNMILEWKPSRKHNKIITIADFSQLHLLSPYTFSLNWRVICYSNG